MLKSCLMQKFSFFMIQLFSILQQASFTCYNVNCNLVNVQQMCSYTRVMGRLVWFSIFITYNFQQCLQKVSKLRAKICRKAIFAFCLKPSYYNGLVKVNFFKRCRYVTLSLKWSKNYVLCIFKIPHKQTKSQDLGYI